MIVITYNIHISLIGSCVLIYKQTLYVLHSLEEHWLFSSAESKVGILYSSYTILGRKENMDLA